MATGISERAYGAEPMHEPKGIEEMLDDVRAFSRVVVQAWQQRGLALNRAERHRLRSEIQATCEMLSTLTATE